MDWNKFWELFHKAWGHCKDSEEYDKKIWNEMQQMLQRMEYDLKKMVTEMQGNRRKQERRKVI
jgi:hypothetical protein